MKNCFLVCFYSFLMCLFLISCQSNEEIITEKIELITSNQKEWDNFNNKVLCGEFHRLSDAVPIDVLDSVLEQEAKEKGLSYLVFNNWNGCKNIRANARNLFY